jgi:hypothetical protein
MTSSGKRPPQLNWFLRAVRQLVQMILALFGRRPQVPRRHARLDVDRFVQSGATDAEVRRILGDPDVIEADQWIYTIDPRRGWRIIFSPAHRVVRVDFWVR